MAYKGDVQKFAPAEVDNVGRVLTRARELISKRKNWLKERWSNERGGFCIAGAVSSASDECDGRHYADAMQRLANAIGPGFGSCDVIEFNNRITTSHKKILALLDRAASPPSGKGAP